MAVIKEYEWGKAAYNQNLIGGIIFGTLALGSFGMFLLTGDPKAIVNIMFPIFVVVAIGGLVSYANMKKNRIFILVTDDGINIAPVYMDFVFSPRVLKWEDISKFEIKTFGKTQKIILNQLSDKRINIKLGLLNKDDRDSLIQIIKENIETKHTA